MRHDPLGGPTRRLVRAFNYFVAAGSGVLVGFLEGRLWDVSGGPGIGSIGSALCAMVAFPLALPGWVVAIRLMYKPVDQRRDVDQRMLAMLEYARSVAPYGICMGTAEAIVLGWSNRWLAVEGCWIVCVSVEVALSARWAAKRVGIIDLDRQ